MWVISTVGVVNILVEASCEPFQESILELPKGVLGRSAWCSSGCPATFHTIARKPHDVSKAEGLFTKITGDKVALLHVAPAGLEDLIRAPATASKEIAKAKHMAIAANTNRVGIH